MPDNPESQKPVQHQPNVADDPLGQKSNVRGVPVHLEGRTVDEKTGMPKPAEDLKAQHEQAQEIEHAGEDSSKENQDR